MTLPRPRVAIDGLGGACVLSNCVPSKTLIESSVTMTSLGRSASLGLELANGDSPVVGAGAPALYARVSMPR